MKAITTTQIEFSALPGSVRSEVDVWTAAFSNPEKPLGVWLRGVAARVGASYSTARRLWDRWEASSHDWRSLVNWARIPGQRKTVAHSPEFLDWWHARVRENQRVASAAYDHFKGLWESGASIPGIPDNLPRHEVPAGFSRANLYRLLPSKATTVAVRQGLSAAKPYLPQVFSTRVGLWPGSHYVIDDLFHDNFVLFRGRPVRVLELDCLDIFSANKFAWGTKPRFQREDGTFDNLKEKFARMIVAQVLYQYGYSPKGTTFLAEHGTAAICQRVEELLLSRLGGLVRVDRSGIIGKDQAFAGLFQGQGGGNFRFKAPLESLRNLIHNVLGDVVGQTGLSPDMRPEHTAGLLKYENDLAKLAAVIPPQMSELLRHPLLEYHSQFLPMLTRVYQILNNRTEHNLEGWNQCGHVAIEYRMGIDTSHWIGSGELMRMESGTREVLAAAARKDNRLVRQRKLSPHEVWSAGCRDLVRIPGYVVAEILGEDFAVERTLHGSYFEFDDVELDPDGLIYEGRVTDDQGREAELLEGTYMTFVNPFDLNQLFVHGSRLEFIGTSRRVQRVCRTDTDSLHAAFGRVAKRHAEIMAPVKRQHAQLTRERTEMLRHNNTIAAAALGSPRAEELPESIQESAISTEDVSLDDFENLPDGTERAGDEPKHHGQLEALEELGD